MIPTQADCDVLAQQMMDFISKFGGAEKAIWLVHAIAGSIGHYEIERDGFELGDECYERDCEKVIAWHYHGILLEGAVIEVIDDKPALALDYANGP